MSIREDLVASAITFLQDPSVSSSPIENKIAFLQSKNLTRDEITAALSRTGAQPPQEATASSANSAPSQQQVATYPPPPPQQYAGYQQPPPPYGWQQQQQAPPVPKRDWRDWFIMATVVGGVGYGLLTLTKRYISPLIVPPTPSQLEQDKSSIDTKFDRAFSLIDQLSADTTELKDAEQARTDRLDRALSDLETVISDLKSSNRRREDDAQRVRDDVKGLKDAIPRAMTAQKDMSDIRLRDLGSELKSLKTLLAQRLAAGPSAASTNGAAALRPSSGNAGYTAPSAVTPQPASVNDENAAPTNGTAATEGPASAAKSASSPYNDYVSKPFPFGSNSAASSGMPASKAAIPAWQLAMANKTSAATSSATATAEGSSAAAPTTEGADVAGTSGTS